MVRYPGIIKQGHVELTEINFGGIRPPPQIQQHHRQKGARSQKEYYRQNVRGSGRQKCRLLEQEQKL